MFKFIFEKFNGNFDVDALIRRCSNPAPLNRDIYLFYKNVAIFLRDSNFFQGTAYTFPYFTTEKKMSIVFGNEF